MPTTISYVPAGTTGQVQFATPQTNVWAGPQVLGGTVQLFTGPSPVGPWQLWSAGTSISGDSFRPLVNQYYYVAAATQQAIVVATDMGAANTPMINQLISMNGVCASGSTTSEQKIFSFKTPPLFLPLNFKMTFIGAVNLTNGAGTKVLNCRMNGVGGTSFFTSPALASNANYNFVASLCGDGTGQLLRGLGAGATGGVGLGGATAYTTLTRDYINNETEFVLTATKGTAGDTFELVSLLVQLD